MGITLSFFNIALCLSLLKDYFLTSYLLALNSFQAINLVSDDLNGLFLNETQVVLNYCIKSLFTWLSFPTNFGRWSPSRIYKSFLVWGYFALKFQKQFQIHKLSQVGHFFNKIIYLKNAVITFYKLRICDLNIKTDLRTH